MKQLSKAILISYMTEQLSTAKLIFQGETFHFQDSSLNSGCRQMQMFADRAVTACESSVTAQLLFAMLMHLSLLVIWKITQALDINIDQQKQCWMKLDFNSLDFQL